MKIKYLGSAAYEGVPSLFCHCEVCRKSKEYGGKNVRTRSQALVNDDLLIDFCPDTVYHYQKYGFDFEKVRDCIITHSHSDHLYIDDVEIAAPHYANEHSVFHFYAARSGYDMLAEKCGKTFGGATATLVEAGKRFTVCNGKYSILPLWANHEQNTSPVIYSVSQGDKRLLYAHDTGVFPENTRELLKGEKHFDLISFDCTGCLGKNRDWRNGHMSLKTNLEMIDFMKSENLVDEKTVFVANHFSHNGGQTYDEMLEEAAKHGITVSYDGLEIEF